mmetsp:Transcript_119341/g.349243  ORF Transcript_119341/g.349243 Transcript_119341/m.349243 type:complete len:320 (+) Transcript_119341:909-1868(+)
MGDHHLLCHEDILGRDLHAQIAACHHDAITGLGDGRKILHASLVFDLGDDLDAAAAQAQRLADELHVIRGLHEGRSNKVHAMDNAKVHKVVLILFLQYREIHLDTRQIAVLPLTKEAVVHDLCHDVVCAYRLDLQREGAVCAEDDAALLHGLAQLVVAQRKAGVVALEGVVRHELQVLTRHEVDLPALLEEARPDLGALGVKQDGHWLVRQLGRLADALDHGAVGLVVPVREVQACHVQARVDELHQRLGAALVGAHGSNDLALALQAVGDVVELAVRGHVQVGHDLRLAKAHLARHGCGKGARSDARKTKVPMNSGGV